MNTFRKLLKLDETKLTGFKSFYIEIIRSHLPSLKCSLNGCFHILVIHIGSCFNQILKSNFNLHFVVLIAWGEKGKNTYLKALTVFNLEKKKNEQANYKFLKDEQTALLTGGQRQVV